MPNTGMLDHRAFRRSGLRSRVHWMEPWPVVGGYTTVSSSRVAGFSRHLLLSGLARSSVPGSRPSSSSAQQLDMGNSISPFHTSMKPTCGYFFSRETDNRKRQIGIPPSNLVAWRSHVHRAQTAH